MTTIERIALAQAIITFAVGLFVFIVYIWQKADAKRTAARIINVEISGAEDRLKALKVKFSDSGGTDIGKDFVLSTNSWSNYRHLFIKDLTDKQWRKLGDFYDDSEVLNEAIKENDSFFGYNSQAIRTARYDAAASFVTKAINDVEAGKFSITQLDGTQIVSPTAEQEIKNRINLELSAFNQILEESLNSANVHYNPKKPINDTDRTLKHIDTGLSDSDIGIKLRKIADRKILFWF